LIIEEDMQVVEDVLVQEMSLVGKKDRVELLVSEVFDVRAYGIEDGCGCRSG
jgi:hypothetical protein